MADSNGNPIATPGTPAGGNAFVVHQVGVPPSQPLPSQALHTVCNAGTDFGQLAPGLAISAQGTLQGFGQVDYFRFFLAQYAVIDAYALGLRPLKYSYTILDDLTGDEYDPAAAAGYRLSLDPGYYCLKVFNPQVLTATPYTIGCPDNRQASRPAGQEKARRRFPRMNSAISAIMATIKTHVTCSSTTIPTQPLPPSCLSRPVMSMCSATGCGRQSKLSGTNFPSTTPGMSRCACRICIWERLL
jgi:hypothetical protein